MSVVTLDTETCGLHGMAVLIQYAWDDGEVNLHSPWTVPIIDTLKLIESFLECDGIIGFNLAFDFFHLVAAVRADRDPYDVHQNKIDAWKNLQNPWITIPNPVKSETNRPFIRVRANDYFGPPRAVAT